MGRRKPHNPAKAALERRARDLEAVGMQGEGAGLAQQANVEVTREAMDREGQKVAHDVARRMDAFDALKDSMEPGAFDAARRLERDYMIRYGQHDHGRPVDRVDCEQAAFNRNDLMIAAGERIDAVMERLSLRDGWLLRDLILPNPARPQWRQAVSYITGETNPNAQGAAVRAACVNLRDAYDRLYVAAQRAA